MLHLRKGHPASAIDQGAFINRQKLADIDDRVFREPGILATDHNVSGCGREGQVGGHNRDDNCRYPRAVERVGLQNQDWAIVGPPNLSPFDYHGWSDSEMLS